jgi:hypothetical protein
MPRRDAIALEGRDGEVQGVLTEFKGGPGRLLSPVAVSVGSTGEILAIEASGQALLFRNPREACAPEFVGAFQVDFASLPAQSDEGAFDHGRVLVPDRSTKAPLVYTL